MSIASNGLGDRGADAPSSLTRRLLVHAGALTSLVIVCLALWVVHRTLQRIELDDVWAHLRSLSGVSILLALVITVVSYFVVTGYDWVALRHINRPLPYARAALAGFLASVVGSNVGFAMVTGGAIRYRIYSQEGLSALEIAGVTTMFAVTATLGVGSLLTLSMLFGADTAAPSPFHVAPELRRTLAVLLIAAVGVYLAAAALRPITLRTSSWSLRLPSASTTVSQITLGTVDLMLVGSITYMLLPENVELSFFSYLGVFATALLAGGVSHVPGGIGVFESVMLLGLPEVQPAALLGAILVFRCMFYLMPLVLAAVVLAVDEAVRQGPRLERARGTAEYWLAEIGPHVMALILILAAVVLLFSGALPAPSERLARLQGYLPLSVLELAHVLAGASGVGLIILARGISQRLSLAYRMAVVLLGAGVGFLLLKGLLYEGAVAIGAVALLLWTTRREFWRRGSLIEQGFPAEWVSGLAVVLAVTVWLGLFSYKQVEYSAELWWHFHYQAEFSRFLRTTAVVFVLIAGIAFVYLRRSDPVPDRPLDTGHEPIRRIVREDFNARANLALLGDKRFLFSDSGKAFVMYRVRGKSWVALGDPVGPRDEHQRLVWTFRELCGRYGGWPVFYLIGGDGLSLYVDLGLTLLKVGDDARMPLAAFSLEGARRAELRKIHGQVLEQGVNLIIVPSTEVPALMAELAEVSDDWLTHSRRSERGFSQGWFSPAYLANFPCAIVRKGSRIIAFTNLWVSADKDELAFDLLRYRAEAPEGIPEFMVVELMAGGRARGYRWFNLGLVPLPDLQGHPLAPLWQRIGVMLYRKSQYFDGAERYRRFAEGLAPVWRPRYLATPGGLRLPRVLRDIAALIARRP